MRYAPFLVNDEMLPLESEAELAVPCFDYNLVQSICTGQVVPEIKNLRFRNPSPLQ